MARDCPNPGAAISSAIVLRGIWSECSRLQFAWNSTAGAFAWNSIGCTWNPWEREATKRRGGGMRDCLGSQMATIWSTSISRFGFIRSKSWCRIQNWFYTSVINSQIHSSFCRPHQNLKSSCLICSLSFKLKLQYFIGQYICYGRRILVSGVVETLWGRQWAGRSRQVLALLI